MPTTSTAVRAAFDLWLRAVDAEVTAISGLGYQDLPDIAYWDLFESGADASEAAQEALAEAGFPLD